MSVFVCWLIRTYVCNAVAIDVFQESILISFQHPIIIIIIFDKHL